jgi:hypothetical protein
MKTISKNARLSVVAVVGLVAGGNAFAMDVKEAAIMNAITNCLKQAREAGLNAQITDASGLKIDPVATAREQRIVASDCLEKLSQDHSDFVGGFGYMQGQEGQDGKLHAVRQIVNEQTELVKLFKHACEVSDECRVVEKASYVPYESKNVARKIGQAANNLAAEAKDFAFYQYCGEEAEKAQNSWFSWFTK